MENSFGQHGWKEFNRNRKDILSELDKILEQTENRPIQVAHGQGVEAYLRKWFSEFLPKKYGVTSGYIIPNLYDSSLQLYHYDIIIYNQLDAPILWTEGNQDQSEQGKYRAIPAKHVVSVYEVKSRLTKSNVTDAINKLNQTKDFSTQLNPNYSCGIIFIDLKESENNKDSIIKELMTGKDVFGFVGGMILRYEGDHSSIGAIKLFDVEPKEEVENKHYIPIAKPIDNLNIYLTEDGNLQIAEQGGGAKLVATSNNNWSVSKTYGIVYTEGSKTIHLDWSRSNFSDFCINLLSALDGLVYNDKNRPSFGQVFDKIDRKKSPLQSVNPEKGKPFLELKLYEGGEHGEKLKIDFDSSDPSIEFIVSIENKGDVGAIVTDDAFKSKCELAPGKTAIKPVKLQAMISKNHKSLKDLLKKEPFEFQYRIVLYPLNTDKDFCAIERTVRITENDIELLNIVE
jgi:hypothetical protein